MKTVFFTNAGEIDPISICTFGVNAKETDNPVGYFGTGLKYSIAIILREGGKITIFNGKKKYAFTKKEKLIRGKLFNIIYMNGDPLGFTTELGKNWKQWQAFRELYCNAKDEDGGVSDEKAKPKKGQVLVEVESDSFHQCYENMGDFILNTKPYLKTDKCDIHEGGGHVVYYQNIRIYEGREHALYTYNIKKDLDITEDRTAAHLHQVKERAANAIFTCENEDIIFKSIHAFDGSFESGLRYDYDATLTPSNLFLDIAEAEYRKPTANKTLTKVLAKYRDLPDMIEVSLNEVNKVMLHRSINFCKRIGYEVDTYKIIVTDSLTGGIMGQAKNNKIYISIDTFGMGTKYLASTLIEEYLHLKTGHGDMTRELQSYLFNEIVNFGELMIGEPV